MKNRKLRKKKNKNTLSLFLFILLFFISAGYAALSTGLSINGLAFLRVPADIRVTNVNLVETKSEGNKTSNPTYHKERVNLYTILPSLDSTVTYEVEITNKASVPYKISNIENLINTNENIEYIINEESEVNLESMIPGNSKSILKITLKYKDTIDSIPENNQTTNEIKFTFEEYDKIAPTLTAKIINDSFNITASDEGGSGLSDENIYKYYLSSSDAELLDGEWLTYTSGEDILVEKQGIHYIWVYSIKDNSGNVNDEKNFKDEYVIGNITVCQEEYTYSYTGEEQKFVTACPGYYKVELWGASGRNPEDTLSVVGGHGGYTSGEINLEKNDTLYIYVGEMGKRNLESTFNGGGKGAIGGTGKDGSTTSGNISQAGISGGGATDIRLVSGTWNNAEGLKSRIMVAGGGGGATVELYSTAGGNSNAGGLIGQNGGYYSGHTFVNQNGKGGTQIAGGVAATVHFNATGEIASGTFGVGGYTNSISSGSGAGGGGGGYYGGSGASGTLSGGSGQGGGGGSSFISGYAGVNAIESSSSLTPTNNTIHYSDKYFINGKMETGVNIGNGKAKITYIGEKKSERLNPKLNNVRYIKDCINGNSENGANHWVEIQAIKDGENLALNKTVSGGTQKNSYSISRITDGDISSEIYAEITETGLQCMTVDLENTYDLDEIAVWHYWKDDRTYNDNITYVSSDNSNWMEVIHTVESETSNGKRVSAYEEESKTYTIVYNCNGGTGSTASSTHTVGVAKNLTSNGCYKVTSGTANNTSVTNAPMIYYFVGWSTSNNATTATYTNGQSVTNIGTSGTVTLYAVWKELFTYNNKYQLINDGSGNWRISFLNTGTFKIFTAVNVDIFAVGGGGGGGYGSTANATCGGGGGGGYTTTVKAKALSANTNYTVTVGAGGAMSTSQWTTSATGGTSSFGTLASAAGGKGGVHANYANERAGGAGGSGGSAFGTGAIATDGADGPNCTAYNSKGGTGQRTTTREFGESTGTLYSTGGNGACPWLESNPGASISNTGNGGNTGYDGGSGIVVIRNKR